MRPVRQGFLRYPLSTLLSTEAAVRVLRELALHGEELTTSQLAVRTGITNQSVRNVLASLARAGLLRTYGQGRAASYQLDRGHPVARMLVDLFRSEDQRVGIIHRLVGEAAERVEPRPLAVWLYGSAARGEDRVDSDVDLLLVVPEGNDAEKAAEGFREEVKEVEKEHHISISVVAVDEGDVLRLARTGDPFWREIVSDAVPIHGGPPEALLARLRKPPRSGTLHGQADSIQTGGTG